MTKCVLRRCETLVAGAQPREANHPCLSAQNGNTALLLAAANGNAPAARLLLDAGADVNAENIVRVARSRARGGGGLMPPRSLHRRATRRSCWLHTTAILGLCGRFSRVART